MYGVSQPTEKLSGPSFRADRLNKPITNKSAIMQAKIANVLSELNIPSRLIMPTAAVGQEWEALLGNIQKLLESEENSGEVGWRVGAGRGLKGRD